MKLSRNVDSAFVDHLKWQTHTNLFRNNYIDLVTGRSLIWLLGFEQNKKLMTDLFLLIYKQQEVDTVIKDFTGDVIADYLKTEHCTNALSFLTVNNALKDQVNVLPGLY